MAERGDVLQFRAKIGFGAGKQGERAVVLQATELNAALPTTVVVPLDAVADPYIDRDLLVLVSADEAGARHDQIAIPTHLAFVRTDRFETGRVGRLKAHTLAELEDKLRLVLDL